MLVVTFQNTDYIQYYIQTVDKQHSSL